MRRYTAFLERGSGAESHGTDPDILSAISEREGRKILIPRGGVLYSVSPPASQTLLARLWVADVTLAPSLCVRAVLGNGEPQQYDAPAGSIIVKPAHVEGILTWSNTRERIVVVLAQGTLQEIAEYEFGSGNTELEPPPFGTVDLTAAGIAQLLKAELMRDHRASELNINALIAMFGIHLLRNYVSWKKGALQFKRAGLTARGAHNMHAYLRENFTRKVSVNELAALAGLSPKHFTQAFTRTFGITPHRYLLDMRLNFAEGLLVGGNTPIADVAFLSGFSSQSHMTTAMNKYRHTTPTWLRRTRRRVKNPSG